MSDAATRSDHGERIARLEQIADDTRRTLDRIEAGQSKLGERIDKLGERIDKMGERIDKMGERIDKIDGRIDRMGDRLDQHFRWTVGMLFTLALATAGGFATLYQLISRLPHT